MFENAVCLITLRPNESSLTFLSTFVHYSLFVIVDDDSFLLDDFTVLYPKIKFIQLDENVCKEAGFINVGGYSQNNVGLRKDVSGWDKGLFYFSFNEKQVGKIWFMEDDVFFYDENTLIDIDLKYTDNIRQLA